MKLLRALVRWTQALAIWGAIAAFFGAVFGVGVVVARLVINALGGA